MNLVNGNCFCEMDLLVMRCPVRFMRFLRPRTKQNMENSLKSSYSGGLFDSRQLASLTVLSSCASLLGVSLFCIFIFL